MMLGQGDTRDAALKSGAKDSPLGYVGGPCDVAAAALYFASDESRYVTGSELTIDGGILVGSAVAPRE